MIFTHPFLFNTIVVLFIAFTSGWMVFVISSKRAVNLEKRMNKLQHEKLQAELQIRSLQDELAKKSANPLNSTPVITLSSAAKINKTK